MTIEEAIQKSLNCGFISDFTMFNDFYEHIRWAILQKEFWIALDKANYWGITHRTLNGSILKNKYLESHKFGTCNPRCIPTWIYQWHKLINFLASGKTIEQFFNQLN